MFRCMFRCLLHVPLFSLRHLLTKECEILDLKLTINEKERVAEVELLNNMQSNTISSPSRPPPQPLARGTRNFEYQLDGSLLPTASSENN